jgi:hypothetical protein
MDNFQTTEHITLLSKKYTLSTVFFVFLVVLFAIRLENITILPLDAHTQRQTLTLSIARNFEDVCFKLNRPKIDIGLDKPAGLGCELPIFNALIYFTNSIFGYAHWYGRLINLIISTIGVWYFFQFFKRYLKETEAFAASVIFAVSLYFLYSRKTMPDTFALSLIFMANYAAMRYLSGGKWTFLLGFGLLSCLGMLAKLPMACAAIFLLIPLVSEKSILKNKILFCTMSALSIGIMSVWYFWWVPYLSKNEGAFTLYETFPLKEGWRQLWQVPSNTWHMISESHLRSYISFSLLLPGFFYLIYQKKWMIFSSFIAYFLIFLYFVISAGYVYPTHEYYGIPFTPAMSLVAGFGAANLLRHHIKFLLPLLLIISFEAIMWQKSDFWVSKDQEKYKNLETIADKFSTKNDRFLVPPGLNFKTFYMLNRKGQGCGYDVFKKHPDWIVDYGRHGLKYIFIEKSEYPDSIPFPVVYDDPNFRAYRY